MDVYFKHVDVVNPTVKPIFALHSNRQSFTVIWLTIVHETKMQIPGLLVRKKIKSKQEILEIDVVGVR
jgi:hypothetical protein